MIERSEQRFDLKPTRLAADTAYGTDKFLGRLVATGITPALGLSPVPTPEPPRLTETRRDPV
jgi:hypothetical protein